MGRMPSDGVLPSLFETIATVKWHFCKGKITAPEKWNHFSVASESFLRESFLLLEQGRSNRITTVATTLVIYDKKKGLS